MLGVGKIHVKQGTHFQLNLLKSENTDNSLPYLYI